MKLIHWILRFVLQRVTTARIYIGRAPQDAPPGTWILFPYNPNILRCGFAAIIEIKQDNDPAQAPGLLSIVKDEMQKLPTLTHLLTTEREGTREALIDVLERATMLRDDATFCRVVCSNGNEEDFLWHIGQSLQEILKREETVGQDDMSQECRNTILVRLKDILWRIHEEYFGSLTRIRELTGVWKDSFHPGQLRFFRHLNGILNILNRLEIRGRDSAGLSIEITLCDELYQQVITKLSDKYLREFASRRDSHDLISLSIRELEVGREHRLTFIFKFASEIGKLGENVENLRSMLLVDTMLHNVAYIKPKRVRYTAHTRWASNGIINIYNCHPVDNEMLYRRGDQWNYAIADLPADHPHYRKPGHIFAMLNGDIDNYDELKKELELKNESQISQHITTDTKIIPLAIESFVCRGMNLEEAFRNAVVKFQGSHAILMYSDLEPGKTFLALKGSGQAIYVGLAPDRYVVASEVYGLVADTDTYLAMDGEKPRVPDDPRTCGQIFLIHENGRGLDGIKACWYDGTEILLTSSMLRKAEITTRDIDRQSLPHFFLKEIYESPVSMQKTLDGKFKTHGQTHVLHLDEKILPPDIRKGLAEGKINKIYCVGQGTASIAAYAIANQMSHTLDVNRVRVWGMKASELSGFCLQPVMDDTLVIAVTQSGTTTDTNRAVDMAKKRGAHTMAIVNRRNSHITHMVDGVFYTSDGRDIEMSVASTKAFYMQVVAGEILTLALADCCNQIDAAAISHRLEILKQLPELMRRVLQDKHKIDMLAAKWAPRYRHWAIVGSGPNRIAAEEIRIKLSELCYKSIACDCVEDKKHIDLSAEPLILVCAAGMPESVVGDIVKDVSIFKAHDSAPIVITNEGETRFASYALGTIELPCTDSLSSLILNTLAGHLFGYYAACSLQNQASFFSGLRAVLVSKLSENSWGQVLASREIQEALGHFLRDFHQRSKAGAFNAALSLSTCTDLTLALIHAEGKLPGGQFAEEFGKEANPENIGNVLLNTLTLAIDELSRPIDAIKHQAKTVTVGTSRLEAESFQGVIFTALADAGIGSDSLRNDIRIRLSQIQPAIASLNGYTIYSICDLDATGQPTSITRISVEVQGGIAKNIASRAKISTALIGTKRAVVQKGKIFLGLGLRDQRPILIVPLIDERGWIDKLILFHITFVTEIPLMKIKEVMGLGPKYKDIQNIVTEANIDWEESLLQLLSPEFLCTHNSQEIAAEIIKNLGQTQTMKSL